MIDLHTEEYISDSGKRDSLVENIVHALKRSGYRLLEFNDDLVFEEVLDDVEIARTVLASLRHRAGFISQHNEFHLKTARQLRREGADIVSYAESVTPWHRQDAWKPEWRMQRFINGATKRTTSNAGRIEVTRDEPVGATPAMITQMNNNASDGTSVNILEEKDVLIGRGGSFLLNHNGNHHFHDVLELHLQAYKLAQSEQERMKVVDNIMTILGEGGFRVLGVNDDGEHVVLSRRSLRRKIVCLLGRGLQQLEEETSPSKSRISVTEKSTIDSTQSHDQPPVKKVRYIAAINDIVVPAMKNGVLPLKGYWKFFPLPELRSKVDLGSTAHGWKLRLEPIAFEAESIMLEVPAVAPATTVYEGRSN